MRSLKSRIKLLVMFLIMTSISLTASCQTTSISGIDKPQKQEIVSTLQAYPLALQQIRVLDALVKSKDREIELLVEKNNNHEKQKENDHKLISNLGSQISLLTKQLKKGKIKEFVIGGSGLLAVIIAVLVK